MIDPNTIPLLRLDPQPKRIAIFRGLYLGDLLLTTPALRALRYRYPEAEITLIGLPWAQEFVKRLPFIDKWSGFPGYPGVLELPYQAERTATFLAEARAISYDLALQMHGDGHTTNGFVADLDAWFSLGYRIGNDNRLTLSLPYGPEEHEIQRWLRLVGVLGATTDDTQIEFPLSAVERSQAAKLLAPATTEDGLVVALHVGAKDEVRRWPPHKFALLADQLVAECGARIVLTGSEAERPLTNVVKRAMRQPALDLAGQTDLGTFAAVVDQVDLLVTNDTGASHLAVAAATPSVVLFGPTPHERWAPLDQTRHAVVDACRIAGATVDGVAALQQLAVEPVMIACRTLFERNVVFMEYKA